MNQNPSQKDWLNWHKPYKDTDSPLSYRLKIVQECLLQSLESCNSNQIRVISICAGQGDDLLGVLEKFNQRDRVEVLLVELDERNVCAAKQRIAELNLKNITVSNADASYLNAYKDFTPADIILACGIFGNIPESDIYNTIDLLGQLMKRGSRVIWTRSRREPDITNKIREYFILKEFKEHAFISPDDVLFGVGMNSYDGETVEFDVNAKMFTFEV